MKKSEYSLLAQTVDWYWWHVAKRNFIQTFLSKFDSNTHFSKNALVLDFGCGVGSNYQLLSRYGKVVGVDISKLALHYASHKPYHLLTPTLGNNKTSAHAVYTMIGCFDVLYHQNIDDEKVLQQFAKLARKNAVLVVTDCAHAAMWSQHDADNMARQRYEARELIAKINQAGWRVKDWSYIFMGTFPLFVISRFMNKVLGGTATNQEYTIPTWLNTFLITVSQMEALILKRFRLPFGSSIIVVAVKD